MDENHYLVLRNGYRLNDIELQAGKIYSKDQFQSVTERRIKTLISGRIVYQGTLIEMKTKQEKLFKISDSNTEIPKKESKTKATK